MKKYIISFLFLVIILANTTAQNQCLTLNGTADNVSLPDLGLTATNTVTIEANIYCNGIQSSWSGILIFSGFRSGLMFRDNNELGYMWEDTNGDRYGWSSGLTVPQNKWVHVAMVVSPTQTVLYLDGAKATHVKSNIASTLGASKLGSDGTSSGRYMNGKISDVRIWSESRTATQIATNICSIVSPTNEATLKAYYPCATANGTSLTDVKSAKNGTLNGCSYVSYANPGCLSPKTIVSVFSNNISETWVGNPVQFADLSFSSPDTQIKNWNWTFEGGTPATSNLRNPSVTYATAGKYSATLTVDTGAVYNSSSSTSILVYPAPKLDRSSWSVQSLSAEQSSNLGTASIDDNTTTFWHTQWSPTTVAMPHYIVYDMHMLADVYGVGYLPRQDGTANGKVTSYAIYVSNDPNNWGNAVKSGTISYSDDKVKVITFPNKANGRYLKFWCNQSLPNNTFASCAELYAYGNYTEAISYANDSTELSTMLKDLTPVYTAPSWVDQKTTPNGPIMGNGDMHVILLGDVNKQKFHISNSEMWSDKGGTYSTTGYRMIPTGGLDIYPVTNTTAGKFRQEMDFQRANITASSQSNFKTETIVCSTDNVMITKLWTDGTAAIPMVVDVWCKADAADLPSTAGLDATKNIMWATRSSFAGAAARWTSRNALATTVTGATCIYSTDNLGKSTAKFTLQPGTIVEIRTVLKGKKGATTHLEEAIQRVGELNADSITNLKSRHLNWWNNFWFHKSWVQTNDMILNKFYYGALYQFGCINRKEFLPAAQHPFCINDDPAWQGDYHMNQEFMGQNCAFFSANRPELSDGAYQILLDYMPAGRIIAATKMTSISANLTPRKGICYNVGLAPWGFFADDFYGGQVLNASCAGSLIIWNYYYNKDINWLRTKGYQYVRELADFWVSHITAFPKENAKYVTWGSSNEHSYNKNPIFDLGLIKQVLTAAIVFSTDLEVDANLRPIWQDIIDNLPNYPTRKIGANGAEVFVIDASASAPNHYTSLEHIWPADAINLSSPQGVRDIACNSIDVTSYWIGPKIAIHGSRVGYPIEKNVFNLKRDLLSSAPAQWSGLRQNGTIGGLRTNGEFMQFIHSSYLQSEEGFIRIFPNWYKNKPAKFQGLKARGAFIVSAEQDGTGVVKNLTITSEKGGNCALLNPWPGTNLSITETLNGVKTPVIATVANDVFSFTTHMGASYDFDISTGIKPIKITAKSFSLYPNPTHSHITINLLHESPTGDVNVVVSDVNGKTLVSQKTKGKQTTIALPELTNAVYFITCNGETEKFVFSKK